MKKQVYFYFLSPNNVILPSHAIWCFFKHRTPSSSAVGDNFAKVASRSKQWHYGFSFTISQPSIFHTEKIVFVIHLNKRIYLKKNLGKPSVVNDTKGQRAKTSILRVNCPFLGRCSKQFFNTVVTIQRFFFPCQTISC